MADARLAPRAAGDAAFGFSKILDTKPTLSGGDIGKTADLNLPDVNKLKGNENCQYTTLETDAALSDKPTRFPQIGPDYGVPHSYEPGGPHAGDQWAENFKKEVGSKNDWSFTPAADAASRSSAISKIESQLSKPGEHGSLYVGQGHDAHILNVANAGGRVIAIDSQTRIAGNIAKVLAEDGYDAPTYFGFLKTK